jgi:hypothetical protein
MKATCCRLVHPKIYQYISLIYIDIHVIDASKSSCKIFCYAGHRGSGAAFLVDARGGGYIAVVPGAQDAHPFDLSVSAHIM